MANQAKKEAVETQAAPKKATKQEPAKPSWEIKDRTYSTNKFISLL